MVEFGLVRREQFRIYLIFSISSVNKVSGETGFCGADYTASEMLGK